jgi:hypothetical protein
VRLVLKTLPLLMLLVARANAFSLIGPYADWMDQTKSYHLPGDIGGPMNIGEGYRWNIPVITYGFERSFLDYFGSNGVAAVEAAIQILNQLPPASQINLESFPLAAWHTDFQAESLCVLDLKSQALGLLLEQMGLADPERYTFSIRDYVGMGSNYAFNVIRRNFDPATAQPTPYVNDTLFTYYLYQFTPTPSLTSIFCDAVEFRVDPLATHDTTAAGAVAGYGHYLSGLSRDDAGGLRYLLSASQIRHESLLADIHGAGTNANDIVRTAYRPGIEKITFVHHPAAALTGAFRPYTNRWTDVYFDGDFPSYQDVERITTYPDIVFTAGDLAWSATSNRTGTTSWVNNADLNGNWGGAGPGVIQPPVVITFNNVGPWYLNPGGFVYFGQPIIVGSETNGFPGLAWASFDGTPNGVMVYPAAQIPFRPTQVSFRLFVGDVPHDFRWQLSGPAYGRFLFQSSTNTTDWTILGTLTNSGVAFSYEYSGAVNESCRFFRTLLKW